MAITTNLSEFASDFNSANNGILSKTSSGITSIPEDYYSPLSLANSAFEKANSAYSLTEYNYNVLHPLVEYSHNDANSGISIAQAAYNTANISWAEANSKFSSSGGTISGSVDVSGSLTIEGDFIVSGNVTTVSANNLTIQDNMIYLNEGANVANPDIGVAGAYNDGTYHHAGFFRDATDGVWKVFDNYEPEPDASVWIDTSNNTFRIADFQANSIIGDFGTYSSNLSANNINSSNNLTYSGTLTGGTGIINIGSGQIYKDSFGNFGLGVTPSNWNNNSTSMQIGSLISIESNISGFVNFGSNFYRDSFDFKFIQDGYASSASQYHGTHRWYTSIVQGIAGNTWSPTQVMILDANGNLGIGASSPSYKLDVNKGSAGTVARFTASADNGRGLSFTSADNGIYLGSIWTRDVASAAGIHAWSINSFEKMRIDSSGNVGIGSSSPNAKLKVALTGSATTPIVNVASFGSAGSVSLGSITNNNEGVYLGTGDAVGAGIACGFGFFRESVGWNSALVFYTNNVTSGPNGVSAMQEKMRINSSGNLGLGVTPNTWYLNSTAYRAFQMGASAILFGTNTAASGNLGLYTNSYLDSSAVNRYQYSSYASKYEQTAGAHFWYTAPSGTAGNAISFTQAMTLAASGNLLIGSTSDGFGSRLFATASTDVPAAVFTKPITTANEITWNHSYVYMRGSDNGYGIAFGNYSSVQWIQGMVNNAPGLDIALNPSASNVFIGTTSGSYKLTLNGQPGANGYTAWTNYSDIRLKENITDFYTNSILDKVCSLRPVTFNYNDKTGFDEYTRQRRISGFIAQEMQEVFPEMVGEVTINGENYLDTNLSNLQLYLLKAIQELHAELESQKTLNQSLLERIIQLETK